MAEASKEFRTVFDAERQSIEEAIAGLDKMPKRDLQSEIDSSVQRIHALEKTLTEKISILPPYDARMCVEAIKSMSEQLNQTRTKLVPKAKFSFKSRKAAGSPSSPSSSTASPTHSAAITPKPTGSPKPTSFVDETQFMRFENRSGEYLFIGSLTLPQTTDAEGRISAKDVALTNLTDCTVNLVHNIPLGAIHIKNLKRCTLVIPPSRMHTSKDMDIYLHVTSEPIIEDCTEMRFAPYGQILPSEQLERLFEAAQLNPARNYFDRVKDFNWLRQQQSPNWRLLDPSEMKPEIALQVLAREGEPHISYTSAMLDIMSANDKIPPHHTLTSLSLTHVQYVGTDIYSKIFAHLTLSPLAITCGYVAVVLTTRDLTPLLMLVGQLLNECTNAVLKRLVKQARPTEYLGDGYGMPSSHSQFMAYFATYMVILMYRMGASPGAVVAGTICGCAFAAGYYFFVQRFLRSRGVLDWMLDNAFARWCLLVDRGQMDHVYQSEWEQFQQWRKVSQGKAD
ncbi:hypothetical protein BGZ70_008873 [Mortierella alpina]|uniref:C-CAP/cofactor C-like domain-containing protein n=1 Tax=Mortierella alpina TaxID=64518 RepID=A0A9P6M1B5_MORAP|nr:hypothetical protein BGZ70_008873 [Mortierella alpina]